VIFIVLWTAIFAFLAIYLLHSPKVRSWLSVLIRAKLLRRVVFISIAIIAAIVIAYKTVPEKETSSTNVDKVFKEYATQSLLKLDSLGRISLGKFCGLNNPKPELAYVMPLILNSYAEIVEKPTKPVLSRINDTLKIKLKGYKQFKNRGIRLTKLLQKKLGNRYNVRIFGENSIHTLQITYTGTPWSTEQLIALPVIEASLENKIDPALLMSLIRHVSNFNFDFQGPRDSHGLLSLGRHTHNSSEENGTYDQNNLEGLSQVFAGAKRLSKQLSVGISQENAIASFYPDPAFDSKPEKWRQSPLIKSWVDQVLTDVEFYRNNGL